MKFDFDLRQLEVIDIALLELQNMIEGKSNIVVDSLNDEQKKDMLKDIKAVNLLIKDKAKDF